MFTGLIQDIGTLESLRQGTMLRLSIEGFSKERLNLGESVSCNGICLSVVTANRDARFEVEASPQTARCTTLGHWKPGQKIQLERALRLGDRLGGHLVQGHVDGVTRLAKRRTEGGSLILGLELPHELARFVVEKGSIAIDGVSLTVSKLDADHFEVTLIPDTLARTTLTALHVGATVNVETDVIGKYIAQFVSRSNAATGVTNESLRRAGFF